MKFYQTNNNFVVFSHKVTVQGTTFYLTPYEDLEEFKSRYLAQLKAIGEPTEDIAFDVQGVVLTTEEQSRFNYIKGIKGLTLDDVNDYVVRGITPTSDAFKVFRLEGENLTLMEAVAMQYEQGIMNQKESELLRKDNINLMDAVAMLYEMMTGGN